MSDRGMSDRGMSDLREAVDRLNARKAAAGIGRVRDGEFVTGSDARQRGVFAGLDLDMAEVAFVAEHVAVGVLEAGRAGANVTPAQAIAAVYADGVIVGLLMAQVRAERDRDAA